MTQMKVYRDKKGVVLNIGDWDVLDMPVFDEVPGEIVIKPQNPIPFGVSSAIEEVFETEDQGLSVEA